MDHLIFTNTDLIIVDRCKRVVFPRSSYSVATFKAIFFCANLIASTSSFWMKQNLIPVKFWLQNTNRSFGVRICLSNGGGRQNLIPVKFWSQNTNRSFGVRICLSNWGGRLARAESRLAVPRIPSPCDFPWLVPKKLYADLKPKSVLLCHKPVNFSKLLYCAA